MLTLSLQPSPKAHLNKASSWNSSSCSSRNSENITFSQNGHLLVSSMIWQWRDPFRCSEFKNHINHLWLINITFWICVRSFLNIKFSYLKWIAQRFAASTGHNYSENFPNQTETMTCAGFYLYHFPVGDNHEDEPPDYRRMLLHS